MADDILHRLLETGADFASALAPSAIGATVAVAMKRGLTWGERLVQILIGVGVSWYARKALEAGFDIDPMLAQGFAFVSGLLAHDALPKMRERAIARLGEAPDLIADWIGRFKGSGK